MRLFFLLAFFCPALASFEPYAAVVIGGGPAGLSCAIECARTGYKTVLIDAPQEGIFAPALPVTNWPGFPSPHWRGAIGTLQMSYSRYGGVYAGTRALSIKRDLSGFLVTTEKVAFRAVSVIVATGRRPPAPPFKVVAAHSSRVLSRLWDESFLTQNEIVAVVGSGSQATESAIRAAARSRQVYLFRQPLLAMDPSEETLIEQVPRITRMYGSKVTGVIENKEGVTIEYMKHSSKLILKGNWVIIANEWTPNSEIARSLVPCDSAGAIIVQGLDGLTSVPGIFACGEVSSTQALQGVLASADGVRTALAVCSFLMRQGFLPTPKQEEERAPPREEPTRAEPKEESDRS